MMRKAFLRFRLPSTSFIATRFLTQPMTGKVSTAGIDESFTPRFLSGSMISRSPFATRFLSQLKSIKELQGKSKLPSWGPSTMFVAAVLSSLRWLNKEDTEQQKFSVRMKTGDYLLSLPYHPSRLKINFDDSNLVVTVPGSEQTFTSITIPINKHLHDVDKMTTEYTNGCTVIVVPQR